eukprot:Skav203374  [mRNA]  locus=scaffold940:404224:404596:- [translate_table: standard]
MFSWVRVAVLAVLAVHVLADNDCDNADDPTSMLQNFQMDRTSPGKQAERGKSELCSCAILHVKLTFIFVFFGTRDTWEGFFRITHVCATTAACFGAS